MFKFAVLLSAIICALGAAVPEGMLPQLDGRIVGGDPTTITSAPYQISIQRRGYHMCGGSIHSPKTIITAAHCLQFIKAKTIRVRAGSTYSDFGGVLVGVDAFKVHEDFNIITMVNDIAIIKLASSLTFSSIIKPIRLAPSTPPSGALAVVTGWGYTESNKYEIQEQLRAVDVYILSVAKCSSNTYSYGSKVKSSMICAAAPQKDACQGDSGGPLVSNETLVGIVSWGYGCANSLYPGVYTDVADFLPWLAKNI